MKNKLKFNYLLFIYIILNMLYVLIGSVLVFNNILKMSRFSYGYIVLLGINILLILILFFKKKYVKNKIDIFLLLIIIFAIISTIFAYKPEKALFGTYARYEGLFTILYYITILFLTSFVRKEDRKKIVYAILIFGFIQCMFGICQKLDLFNLKTLSYKGDRWATGFTKNPNFFGTLLLICLCYAIGLFIDKKDSLKKILYLLIISLLFIGLLFTNALSSLVGLFVVMIVLLVYAIKNKYIKKYILLCLVLVTTLLSVHLSGMTTIIDDVIRTKNETTNIVKGDLNNDYGTGRIELWKKTIKIVPNYLLHGVGIDSFSNVLDGKPIWRIKTDGYKVYYDKAHNEYLQILVTMGIFSLISYLCLHFIIIKNGIKETFKNKEIYYVLPVIGYLVQAQFNISVIEVAPLFYIGLGLLINRKVKILN